jgi:FMN phosphatase YigB (HAD superfamily)
MGTEKPDVQFFNLALREIEDRHPQLTPQDVIYVGDHYEKDVLTPQSIGIQAQWIVRDARDIASGDTHSAAGVKPLNSLRDLLALKLPDEDRVLDTAPLRGAAH